MRPEIGWKRKLPAGNDGGESAGLGAESGKALRQRAASAGEHDGKVTAGAHVGAASDNHSGSVGGHATVNAKGAANDVKAGAETAGHDVKVGAEATGHEIKKGANAVGNAAVDVKDDVKGSAKVKGDAKVDANVKVDGHASAGAK